MAKQQTVMIMIDGEPRKVPVLATYGALAVHRKVVGYDTAKGPRYAPEGFSVTHRVSGCAIDSIRNLWPYQNDDTAVAMWAERMDQRCRVLWTEIDQYVRLHGLREGESPPHAAALRQMGDLISREVIAHKQTPIQPQPV